MFLVLLIVVGTEGYLTLPLKKNLTDSSMQSGILFTADYYYSVEVEIGTPGKKFNLALNFQKDVRTIQHTWVEWSRCYKCSKLDNQYDPVKSSSSTNTSNTGFNGVGTCSLYYDIFSDIFTFSSQDSRISTNYEFNLVVQDTNCKFHNVDGMLSLVPSGPYQTTPLISSLKELGQIEKAVFSLYFSKNEESESFIEIGGFDLSKFSSSPSEFFYIKNEVYNNWKGSVESVFFGDLMLNEVDIGIMIVNTAKGILGDLNTFYKMIPYLSSIGLDCSENEKGTSLRCERNDQIELPGVRLEKGGNTLWLDKRILWDCDEKCCRMNVEFTVVGYWLFGQTFLEEYFTVYDFDNHMIGFAPAKQ